MRPSWAPSARNVTVPSCRNRTDPDGRVRRRADEHQVVAVGVEEVREGLVVGLPALLDLQRRRSAAGPAARRATRPGR